MRISDWSSDVCSSDLSTCATPIHPSCRVFHGNLISCKWDFPFFIGAHPRFGDEVPHLTTGLYPLKLRQCLVFTIQIRLLIVHEALSTCSHYPPTSRASSLISTPASAFDTGHPSLAVSRSEAGRVGKEGVRTCRTR